MSIEESAAAYLATVDHDKSDDWVAGFIAAITWARDHDAQVRAEERERCASLIEPGFRIEYVLNPKGLPALDPTERVNRALHRAAARIREQGKEQGS